MSRPTTIRIDKNALLSNTRLVQSFCPNSKIIAVIKADAYGHGAIDVARILESQNQIAMFAVSSADEALELRHSGIAQPIMLLEGCFSADELASCVKYGFEPVTHNLEQVEMLTSSGILPSLNLWLKVDTGMHRLGLAPELVELSLERLENCETPFQVRLLTHLSNADVLTDSSTSKQMACFTDLVTHLDKRFARTHSLSIANSAGIMAWPESHQDWVRPGIMLYGLSPSTSELEGANRLRPVMSFHSQVIAVREVAKGETVGYGNTWLAQHDSVLATIAVGYGDGYPRNAKSGTPVLINNQRAYLAGRVSMDMISVDVSHIPQVKVGDSVELWGANLSANEVAKWADTIGYELVTRLPKRTPRIVV